MRAEPGVSASPNQAESPSQLLRGGARGPSGGAPGPPSRGRSRCLCPGSARSPSSGHPRPRSFLAPPPARRRFPDPPRAGQGRRRSTCRLPVLAAMVERRGKGGGGHWHGKRARLPVAQRPCPAARGTETAASAAASAPSAQRRFRLRFRARPEPGPPPAAAVPRGRARWLGVRAWKGIWRAASATPRPRQSHPEQVTQERV